MLGKRSTRTGSASPPPRLLAGLLAALALQYALTAPAYTADHDHNATHMRTHVAAALDAQDLWLGHSANAQAWHGWLGDDAIRRQLAATDAIDTLALADVLARYRAGLRGLDDPHFIAVRHALTAWLAALPQPTPADLAEWVRDRAAGDRSPLKPVADCAAALRKAVDQLNAQLAREPKYGAAWRTYLATDELLDQLARAEAADLARLETLAARYQSGHAGLDRAAVTAVRERLSAYLCALRVARLDDPTAAAAAQLAGLAEQLQRDDKRRRQRTLDEIAASLDWLTRHGVAPSVARAVERVYRQPNVSVHLAGALFSAQFERQLDEQFDVNNSLGGAQVRGTGQLSGRVQLMLVPCPDQALLRLTFTGRIETDTVGHSGPIGFASRGATQLTGQQHIVADSRTVRALPTEARADTALAVTGVWSTLDRPLLDRVVRRVGRQRLAEARPGNEINVSRRAEDNIRTRFDAEGAEIVAALNEALVEQLRVPLSAQKLYPRDVRLSTTVEHLVLQATLARDDQLAALTPAPPLDRTAPIALAMHESFFNNAAHTSLAGRTIESHELAATLEQLMGAKPEGFETVDGIPWSITAAERLPIETRISSDGVQITIRSTRITAGPEEMSIPLAVTARYRARIEGRAIVFDRQGPLTVIGPCLNDLSQPQADIDTSEEAVRARFEMLLAERLAFTTSQLPLDGLLKDELAPTRCELSDDGWLNLAFDRQPAANTARVER